MLVPAVVARVQLARIPLVQPALAALAATAELVVNTTFLVQILIMLVAVVALAMKMPPQ
jgi:hypothetical protein